ncbi:type VI secretion system secreted protein VgrG [Variovorax sp. TBS-050B]|uniref:type VI secretion system Vgr family protein n=1 Tax=Variovorax sp. TBS-050B TaxID=2940551 RepID=UPI002476EF75|nr:type VI secretion system tip protein TssI/VgrG [Variovorax sp. TBS-050B]MDH6591111.1 type VI secretion system secreted protein VgrG [Variovorax sp. TBS-050B]
MSSIFSTGSRTISVDSAAMPSLLGVPALEFKSLQGTEALGELFEYTVRLQTPDNPLLTEYLSGNVPVKQLLGKEFGIRIALDGAGSGLHARTGAGTREINGLVTRTRFVQHENRRSIYEITLRPWLVLACHTSDHRIFQNKTALQIVEEVLADYSFPTEKRTTRTYPVRTFQVQYGETDFEFITRLMQEFGLYYFFEHGDGTHRLVLVDDAGAHRRFRSEAYHTIRHHPPGHKIDEEYCDSFHSTESLASGQWTTSDFDFTRPRARLEQVCRMPRDTGHNAQELYRWPGDYSEPEEGRDLARTRMEATGAPASRGQGGGSLRGVVTGCTFALAGHPQDSANRDYLVIASSLRLHENAHASGGEDAYLCRCDFEVQPAETVFRSPQTQPKPRTMGPQTAIVTGPAGEDLWTDEYGRVKLSFHWNRYCTRDENASCWIRVASTWAGTQFGGMHVPRIGQEVIVDFENGDPDRPIVTGRVYNRLNMPPRELPGQAGLSGFRSSELHAGTGAGARGNHMTLDDHPGKIQAQLKSDHLSSSLSLGHIGRIEDTAGRKDDRGQGAELRTDGHGAVRAARGLLVSTEARADARAHITDMGETVFRLGQAQALHEATSGLALQAGAHEAGDQDAVMKVVARQNAAIEGKSGAGGASGARGAGEFAEFEEPHLVLASPCGIHASTGGSTHVASTQHNAWTSGGHTSIGAGGSLLASVKEAVRLFAYKAIRLTAATAGIDVVALQQGIRLLARLDIRLEAERISITAKEEILVNGAGSYSRWNASGIVHGTRGIWRQHAATHSMTGPDSRNAETMNRDIKAPFDQEVVFHHRDEQNTPAARQSFKLVRGDAPAPLAAGSTGNSGSATGTDGTTRLQRSDGPEIYKVRWTGKNKGEV